MSAPSTEPPPETSERADAPTPEARTGSSDPFSRSAVSTSESRSAKRSPTWLQTLACRLFPPPKPRPRAEHDFSGPTSPPLPPETEAKAREPWRTRRKRTRSDLPAFAPPFVTQDPAELSVSPPAPIVTAGPDIQAPPLSRVPEPIPQPSHVSPAPAIDWAPSAPPPPEYPTETEPESIAEPPPDEPLVEEPKPLRRRLAALIEWIRQRRNRPFTGRFEPLDLLRGLAVLGMAFSGMVPGGDMPAWLYHAQLPPPTHAFNDQVYGITWVDLVFPFFLFSMGASIPLALGGRLEKGIPMWKVVLGLFARGLLLATYGLVGQHLRPFVLAKGADEATYWVTLIGFVCIGLMLVRWPAKSAWWLRWPLTLLGWAGALFIVFTWSYPDGTVGFANYRNDIILMVLANVAVSGGLIWLATRGSATIRWILFAAVAAIFLTQDRPGLGQIVWNWTPYDYLPWKGTADWKSVPILYHFEFHKYLLIVLPGTFVGDLIREYGATPFRTPRKPMGATWATFVLAIVGPAMALGACAGLLAREVVGTFLGLAVTILTAWLFLVRYPSVYRSLPGRLFRFGVPLLFLGFLCEPLGGGIRKDEPTLSYFFVTAGLGAICLASFTCVWIGMRKTALWRLISDTGFNPIMGYLVITNLTTGLAGLLGLEAWVAATGVDRWSLVAWAGVKTLFVAVATAWFTRRKIFLRA